MNITSNTAPVKADINAEEWTAVDPDRVIALTFFPNEFAKEKVLGYWKLSDLAAVIPTEVQGKKQWTPWLHPAVFGEQKSDADCYRHDENVEKLTGIPADYDTGTGADGTVHSFEYAQLAVRRAGVAALLYKTPSDTPGEPRWRVICPLSHDYVVSDLAEAKQFRHQMNDRVNGVLGGGLDPGSWDLSRSYHFGSVAGKPPVEAVYISGDYIDLRPDLDTGAIGKGGKRGPSEVREPRSAPEGLVECDDDADLLREAEERIKWKLDNPKDSHRTATGNGTRALANWLLDMRAGDKILSITKVAELIVDSGWALDGAAEDITGTPDRTGIVERVAEARESDRGCDDIIARRQKVPEPDFDDKTLREIFGGAPGIELFDAADLVAKKPPPRQWLLGNSFCRTFLSSITAAGGGAKTSVRVAQHLAMATGLPLTGEKVHQRCRVLLVSLEDDIDELNRRITAAMIHHKIDPEEARGYLFVCAPKGLRLMIMGEGGQPVRAQLYHELRRWVVAKNIDVVSLDPFVKTHSLPENDNSALDKVAELLAELAIEFKIAVDCPHHVHKGVIKPGDADAGRGAGAVRDAARLVFTLCPMSSEEAKAFDIPEEQRRRYIRMDPAKVNITPPAEKAMWFHLASVAIGNGNEMYPEGDRVQAIERWQPPELKHVLTAEVVEAILKDIDAGFDGGYYYSAQPRAGKNGGLACGHETLPRVPRAGGAEIGLQLGQRRVSGRV